jgi:hypothetical protein
MKVIRQGIVLWAQFTQDALGVLIDVLEPDWGMPAAVETVERDAAEPDAEAYRAMDADMAAIHADLARPGAW